MAELRRRKLLGIYIKIIGKRQSENYCHILERFSHTNLKNAFLQSFWYNCLKFE